MILLRTEDVAQALEHLLCECEALSSNPSHVPPEKNDIIEVKLTSRSSEAAFMDNGYQHHYPSHPETSFIIYLTDEQANLGAGRSW
jgi:hypothetical protein